MYVVFDRTFYCAAKLTRTLLLVLYQLFSGADGAVQESLFTKVVSQLWDLRFPSVGKHGEHLKDTIVKQLVSVVFPAGGESGGKPVKLQFEDFVKVCTSAPKQQQGEEAKIAA